MEKTFSQSELEAIAAALGDTSEGLTGPEIGHFVSWLGRQGRFPAEVMLKQKLEKILGKINHART